MHFNQHSLLLTRSFSVLLSPELETSTGTLIKPRSSSELIKLRSLWGSVCTLFTGNSNRHTHHHHISLRENTISWQHIRNNAQQARHAELEKPSRSCKVLCLTHTHTRVGIGAVTYPPRTCCISASASWLHLDLQPKWRKTRKETRIDD